MERPLLEKENMKEMAETEGARRASGVSAIGAGSVPDPEVVEKPKRRRFSAEYRLRIVREADVCKAPGEVGALLRREGLYSSLLSAWRRQRDAGALASLRSRKRGPKPKPVDPRVKRLEREVMQLRRQLEQAETIIEIRPKKSCWDPGDPPEDLQARRERLMTATVGLPREVATAPVCLALGLNRATVYRRRNPAKAKAKRPRPSPARALDPSERQEVLDTLHSERFCDRSPMEVYATLLEEGPLPLLAPHHVPHLGRQQGNPRAAQPLRHATSDPSSWPPGPTRSGRGTSPSSRVRSSGPTSTST